MPDRDPSDLRTYAPLDTLKAVADDIWIVDGPLIRFGFLGIRFPFPTRMTIVRTPGGLFLHSPTRLTPTLQTEVARLGPVRWIVGPNRIHYWWIPDWRSACPDAEVWLAPRIREQAGTRIDFPAHDLSADSGYPWDDAIATIGIAGRYMSEFDFFHRASRTLILTDLIENFEPHKVPSRLLRALLWIAGARAPDSQMPRDMRFNYDRARLRAAVETMIGWQPERIILAHGKWHDRNGAAELRRAFRWLLT